MTAVFSHGRLRLYLLKLLSDGPRHGYELIRLLENRFLGLYAPSAGTIYPRLARMEMDGLISHRAAGSRKTYEITDAGRAELAGRGAELAELESEIHASVADLTALAAEVEQGVRGSVRDLKRELREATRAARAPRRDDWRHWRDAWNAGAAPESAPVEPDAAPITEVERKVMDLASEVRRLVRAGRATAEDQRVAGSVLDSVRDQIRHILRG
jgi:DNA-binding PadR family transcriptional regulator